MLSDRDSCPQLSSQQQSEEAVERHVGTGSLAASKPVPVGVCGYLADVEGNLDLFERYLAISKILEWADTQKTRLRFKRDDAMFVFGGDTQVCCRMRMPTYADVC
jgi:hypothetical protein